MVANRVKKRGKMKRNKCIFVNIKTIRAEVDAELDTIQMTIA